MFLACADEAPERVVATYDIEQTPTALTIRGRDEAGVQVASIALSTGRFVMQDDDRGEVHGRQLAVEVLGEVATHESEGMQPLRLPLLTAAKYRAMNDVLTDARVTPLLATWGVAFEHDAAAERAASPHDGEVGHAACNPAPSATCAPTSCDQDFHFDPQDPNETCPPTRINQYVCCAAPPPVGTKKAAHRKCFFGASNPCGTEGGAGCAVCWNVTWGTFCNTGISPPRTLWCDFGGGPMSWNGEAAFINHD